MDRLLTYTGIGARQTPPKVLADLDYIAAELASKGWCLCSGSARGADSAFGDGAPIERQEIWIPQPGSNGHRTGDPSVKLLDRDTAARAEVIDDSGPDLRHVRPGARRRRPQRERQRAAALLDRRLVAPAVLNGLCSAAPAGLFRIAESRSASQMACRHCADPRDGGNRRAVSTEVTSVLVTGFVRVSRSRVRVAPCSGCAGAGTRPAGRRMPGRVSVAGSYSVVHRRKARGGSAWSLTACPERTFKLVSCAGS